MTHSHTYKKCYELLNVNEQCTTDELKKSYKKLIQKWHPDRYETDSEKEIATNKITHITTAYKQLSDYQRKNGCFPAITPARQATPIEEQKPRDETPQKKPFRAHNQSSQQPFSQSNTQKRTSSSTFFKVTAIIILFILIYPYFNEESTDARPSQFRKAEKKQARIAPEKKKVSDKKRAVKKKFFTYGSSLGDVILAQGPPERMEANIWYYGKSEVHFKDGAVVYWFRDNKTPLNAQIALQKD